MTSEIAPKLAHLRPCEQRRRAAREPILRRGPALLRFGVNVLFSWFGRRNAGSLISQFPLTLPHLVNQRPLPEDIAIFVYNANVARNSAVRHNNARRCSIVLEKTADNLSRVLWQILAQAHRFIPKIQGVPMPHFDEIYHESPPS